MFSSVGLFIVWSQSCRSPDIKRQNRKVPPSKITNVNKKTLCHSSAVYERRKGNYAFCYVVQHMADHAGEPGRVREREATQGSGLEKNCIV